METEGIVANPTIADDKGSSEGAVIENVAVEAERGEDEHTENKSNASVESSASSSTANTRYYGHTRDSSWLELSVCREYALGECSRSANECKYAHPTGSVIVKDGKVTCCFDYLKDRCAREACKYLHPSQAVKERLVMAGKQHGQAMAVTSKTVPPPLSPTPVATPMGGAFSLPYLNTHMATGGHIMFQKYPAPIPLVPTRVEICEEFDVADCMNDRCLYAHPESYVRRNSDNTVSVCFNYVQTGYCRHNTCWFYHPPPHMLPYLVQGLPYITPYIDQSMFVYSPTKSPYSLSPPHTPFGTALGPPMPPTYSMYSTRPHSITNNASLPQTIVS